MALLYPYALSESRAFRAGVTAGYVHMQLVPYPYPLTLA